VSAGNKDNKPFMVKCLNEHGIAASVGDQVSDMSFGHLMHGFLLPNTMYYLH